MYGGQSLLQFASVIQPPKGAEDWKSRALTDQLDLTASILDIAGAGPDDAKAHTLTSGADPAGSG
jgi:hypothetical protein